MAPPTNDFLAFATAPGANVASQAGYLADPIVPAGFASGLLVSAKTNKVWRQSSFVAASVAQLIFETLDVDVLDNGDLGTFVDLLEETIARLGTGGIHEAPVNGRLYGRRNRDWAEATPESPMDGRIYGRQSGGWMPSVPEAPLDRFVYARSGSEQAWYAAPREAPADGLLYGRNGQLISWQPVPGEAPPDGTLYGRRGSDRSWQPVGSGGGNTSITISDVPPANAVAGQLWFDSTVGQLFIRYQDPTSTQWLICNSMPLSSGLVTLTKVANYTITTADVGVHFNNIGATQDIVLTLPAAAKDLRFGFAIHSAHAIRVRATGSDIIARGAELSTGGGYIRSNYPYSFVQLEAHGPGIWLAVGATGTWSIDS